MRKPTFTSVIGLISGVLLIAAGICTFVNPSGSLTWLVTFYGVLAIITGAADIIFYIRSSALIGFAPMLSLVLGVLSVMAGTMLIVHPGAISMAVVLLLPLWFITHCIARLVSICQRRYELKRAAFNLGIVMNVLGIVLGILMVVYPYISFVSAGVLVGTYLLLLGIDSILAAVTAWRAGQ